MSRRWRRLRRLSPSSLTDASCHWPSLRPLPQGRGWRAGSVRHAPRADDAVHVSGCVQYPSGCTQRGGRCRQPGWEQEGKPCVQRAGSNPGCMWLGDGAAAGCFGWPDEARHTGCGLCAGGSCWLGLLPSGFVSAVMLETQLLVRWVTGTIGAVAREAALQPVIYGTWGEHAAQAGGPRRSAVLSPALSPGLRAQGAPRGPVPRLVLPAGQNEWGAGAGAGLLGSPGRQVALGSLVPLAGPDTGRAKQQVKASRTCFGGGGGGDSPCYK